MAIWDKLKTELDRAGKAAQNALDEGKVRLEAFRTRQLADKAAQALGYAVYRAKQSGSELDAETSARLLATLRRTKPKRHDSSSSSTTLERRDQKRRRRGLGGTSTAVFSRHRHHRRQTHHRHRKRQ